MSIPGILNIMRTREPPLRVARGLFRVWLVLSALWIAGMAYMVWGAFDSIDWVETQATSKWDTRCPANPSNRFEEIDCLDRPSPEKLLAAKAAASKTATEERRALFWRANLLAFLPPAFLLALGSALVWAFRGFRL